MAEIHSQILRDYTNSDIVFEYIHCTYLSRYYEALGILGNTFRHLRVLKGTMDSGTNNGLSRLHLLISQNPESLQIGSEAFSIEYVIREIDEIIQGCDIFVEDVKALQVLLGRSKANHKPTDVRHTVYQ